MVVIGEEKAPPLELSKRHRVDLMAAKGTWVADDCVEWVVTPATHGLTDREVELIKKKLKVTGIDYQRALAIKQMMTTKKCVDIIMHFGGVKKFSASTIKKVHAALSQAEREWATKKSAKQSLSL